MISRGGNVTVQVKDIGTLSSWCSIGPVLLLAILSTGQ